MVTQNPVQSPDTEEVIINSSHQDDAAAGLRVCRTVLISDVPSATDKFGTHGRVARAIAELIASDAEGVSVGVEGNWGSGKTTVFNLLRAHFANRCGYAVIPFDAWAHEGDPLRLTFLQAILQSLQARGWVTEARREHWKDELERIANRRQTEVTKDYPSLSGAGKWFSIALLLVPLSAAFANAALRDDNLTLFTGNVSPRFVLLFGAAISLAGLPLLILLFQWWTMSEDERKKSSGPWSLLFTKGVAENRRETQKTANPTSIDFEKTFDDLMKEALGETKDVLMKEALKRSKVVLLKGAVGKSKGVLVEEALRKLNRRLVLVLDNLDRVDSDVALAIWSTLQTFLRHRSGDGAQWAKRLWVVALYDRRGLSLIWEKGATNEADGQSSAADAEQAAAPPAAAPDEPEGAAQSFMDKSFQLRFEVAAPVLSNWRDFLIELLREAFPDHRRPQPGGNGEGPPSEFVEPDFHAVYRVMAIYLNRRRLLPTIRELKLYVNQIGAVHRQWSANSEADPPRDEDVFSLAHMAYFALLRRQGRDVVRGLLATSPAEKLPEPEYVDLLGDGIADNLAALAFNVEVKLARQLLISPELKNALGQGELGQGETEQQSDPAETLKGLAASYPKGFWEVLEETVREEWKGDEAPKVAYAAYNLERSGLLANAARPEVKNVTDSLCTQAGKVKSWSSLDERKAQGLAAILKWKRRGDTPRARRYIDGILRAVADGLDSAPDIGKWAALTKILRDELEPPVTPAGLPELPNLIFKNADEPDSLADVFDEALVETLAAQLVPRIGRQPPPEKISGLLEALTELRGYSPRAGLRLGELAKDGRLLLHWRLDPDVSPFYPLLAWILFVYLREVPSAEIPDDASAGVKQNHELIMNALRKPEEAASLLSEFTKLIIRYSEISLLFSIQKNLPDAGAFCGLCLKQILEGDSADLLTPSQLVSNWSAISDALEGPVLDGYIKRLVSEHNLTEFLKGNAFNYKLAGLYRKVIASGGMSDREFLSWFARELRFVDKSQWVKELVGEGDLLQGALKTHEAGVTVRLGQPYQQALLDHADVLLSSQDTKSISPVLYVNNPATLLDPQFAEQFRTSLYKHAKRAARAKAPISADFFEIYGRGLLLSFELQKGEKSYSDLFIPLLKARNAGGLKWMEQVFRENESLKSDARQSQSIEAFKAALREEQYGEIVVPRMDEQSATPAAPSTREAFSEIEMMTHVRNLARMFGVEHS
jgi:hypothetical protein